MAAPTFTSITPALGGRIPTNSYFEIKYTGTELDTIYEHYITFEDSDGEPIAFTVSAVVYSGGINTFTITPDAVLTKNSYYDITLLTSIKDLASDSIIERSFKFITKKVDETATIEGSKVGQPLDVYYKKNLIPDLLDNRDIILEGDKFNFSYIPSEYDVDSYTYDNAGDEYLVHDLLTYLKEKLNEQYFEGYDNYFSNLKAFEILTTSEFLNIEKALYTRPSDVSNSSGLVRKIKFIIELYATASGKHFVLVEPDPIDQFKYYITTDIPITAWNGVIKPLVHPIGWQEKYVELGSYYVEYDEWAASTAYIVGDRLQVEGEENIFWVVECSVAGTSGLSAPQWITEIVTAGSTIVDNGVTWTVIERLYQIHNFETERYNWTEEQIDEFRDFLYIKGEGRALTVPYVTTTTNLDLSNTDNLYLRAVSGLLPARIVRETGSFTIDKIISGCDIYITGGISANDGTYTVDTVIDQTVVESDDMDSDNVSDWTTSSSDIVVSFDTNHYEIKTAAVDETINLENVEFVFGRTYQVSASIKNGTKSAVELQFYIDDGAVQLSATKTTTASWTDVETDISTKFIAASSTTFGEVGIKVLTDQGGLNFEIKSFACTELSQIDLVSTEDFAGSDEIVAVGAGFELNDRSSGIWIDGFLRPDPDPNEAINDPSSDLYDSDALSPDYPITTVGNWAHSEYEKYLDEPTWEASTSYSVGDLIIVNDYILRCTTAGTSGSTEPLWSFTYTSGETITDGAGTLEWTLYDLYNTNGWQASKSYYVGNKILVENFIVECTIAGTSGVTEPTWTTVSSTSTPNIVTDNTVTWKMLEVIETSRRDLLNVRNAIKTFPKFPLSYLEGLTIIGISDVSAIVYDTFSRPDLANKPVEGMTEQYDGDPFAEIGREEYAHVTELKLVRGSAVSSFSNLGEDITFLYTSEANPVIWIQSTTFTTNEFSFGNTDLANTEHVTVSTTGNFFTVDSFTDPAGTDYQDVVFESSEHVTDIGAIETGDSLVISGATNAENNGTFIVYRHDAYNRTITIINPTGVPELSPSPATAQHTTPTFYDMETFLIPGTFSFDDSLYYGYAKIIAARQIDPNDWYSTKTFKYNYWTYDCGITYTDDTAVTGTPDEPLKSLLDNTDNFSTITKDNLYGPGASIVFKSHRYGVNSLVDGWYRNNVIYEYTDSGAGVPASLLGTPFCIVEADIAGRTTLVSDDCSKNYVSDWTVEASVTATFDSSNSYYEITSSAANQHVYIDTVELEQDHVYQIICEMVTDSTVDVNLAIYDGDATSWVEGSTTISLTSSIVEYSEIFTYNSTTDPGCAVGLRVQTDMSSTGEVGLKNFIVYDITNNLIVVSYLNGGTTFDDSTPKYYSKYSSIPSGTVLTSDTTYCVAGDDTDNLDPPIINTYDRKVDVMYNIPDLFDYDWVVTDSGLGTPLTVSVDNLLTFFAENTGDTCGVSLNVNSILWRTDKTLLDTGTLTFDNRTNTLTRSTGDWTADTTPVVADDIIYIKGSSLNDGYYKIKTVSSSALTMTEDIVFNDEEISTLPENTEVDGKVIKGWTPEYYTITPSTLTAL